MARSNFYGLSLSPKWHSSRSSHFPLKFCAHVSFPLHFTAIPSKPITIECETSLNIGIFQFILHAIIETPLPVMFPSLLRSMPGFKAPPYFGSSLTVHWSNVLCPRLPQPPRQNPILRQLSGTCLDRMCGCRDGQAGKT